MMTRMPITPIGPYISPLSNDDAGEPPLRASVAGPEAGGQVCIGEDVAGRKHSNYNQQFLGTYLPQTGALSRDLIILHIAHKITMVYY